MIVMLYGAGSGSANAMSAQENEVLTEGSVVEVVAISGVKLICTPVLGAAPVVENAEEPKE